VSGCRLQLLCANSHATTATYSDSSLTGSTSYSYRVRAGDTFNNLGPYSGTATATTPAPIITAPTNLTATAVGNNQVNLSWSVSAETGGTLSIYYVERCQGRAAAILCRLELLRMKRPLIAIPFYWDRRAIPIECALAMD